MAEGNDQSVAETSGQRPSVLMAGLLVVGVVPFMAGLLALYAVLGVGMQYVGFFFLLYWAGILHQQPAQFLPSVIGGVGGLALGWVLLALPAVGAPGGKVAAGVILAAVLFCFMRGHLKLIFNNAMMLFLIVSTIPDLHVEQSIGIMIASLAVGATYMGGVAMLVSWIGFIAARRKIVSETTNG
ncbi:hypothetical protein PMI04_011730 [Sphingobium sp. AP49]|uniref:hypothetical protein n=1 Tax=Sphingobium sp. AP49 TaxID=1144307 RepID=UPI00026ED6D9|nr:hypothetical protein [Sphingobium sp. AP49]WHO37242.1 hypothetical protein PMI04_011730 [Sphingobium sp. AP49]